MRFLLKLAICATTTDFVIPIIWLGMITTTMVAYIPVKSEAQIVRYAARCSYHGCKYHGFQLQLPPERIPKRTGRRDEIETKTVQGELETALSKHFGLPRIPCIGAGRTDAGVHALGQAIHFDIPKGVVEECGVLQDEWNRLLPPEIRVYHVQRAPSPTSTQKANGLPWHVQYNAIGKRYTYMLSVDEVLNPLNSRWCAHFPQILYPPLNLEVLEKGTQIFVGTHNFAGFAVAQGGSKRAKVMPEMEERRNGFATIRTIEKIETKRDGPYITITFTLNGALYKMIRRIVGCLIALACGTVMEEELLNVLETGEWRDPQCVKRFKSAPARGLVLDQVLYKSADDF